MKYSKSILWRGKPAPMWFVAAIWCTFIIFFIGIPVTLYFLALHFANAGNKDVAADLTIALIVFLGLVFLGVIGIPFDALINARNREDSEI